MLRASRRPSLAVALRAAVVVATLTLTGCAGMTLPWRAAPEPVTLGKPAGGMFYAKADDVAVRAEPSRTADVVTLLRRDQAVVRRRVANGWAYVEVRGTRSAGWVDAGLLTSRRPGSTTGAPATGTPQAPAGAAPEPEPEPEPEPAPPPTTGYPSPAPDDAARPAPGRPTPSIFDPY